MFVMPEKNMLEWDDVFPFIYLMAAFEGIDSDTDVKHLVIDEMQDYTPVQYEVLNMVYPCRKTILGDFGQMINPCHVHTLNDMKTIYEGAEFAELNRSYRSTYEIMSYANAVCRQPRIEMIERHGSKPQKKGFDSETDEVTYIEERLSEFEESESGSMDIIIKSEKDAEKLFDIISQRHDVNFVCKDSASYLAELIYWECRWQRDWNLTRCWFRERTETDTIRNTTGTFYMSHSPEPCTGLL